MDDKGEDFSSALNIGGTKAGNGDIFPHTRKKRFLHGKKYIHCFFFNYVTKMVLGSGQSIRHSDLGIHI